jgi:hypothetical protein
MRTWFTIQWASEASYDEWRHHENHTSLQTAKNQLEARRRIEPKIQWRLVKVQILDDKP